MMMFKRQIVANVKPHQNLEREREANRQRNR